VYMPKDRPKLVGRNFDTVLLYFVLCNVRYRAYNVVKYSSIWVVY
jgi:hypothetical protein